jgi:hypothetical protein
MVDERCELAAERRAFFLLRSISYSAPRDGSWWAWVSWVHEAGGRRDHKVVLVRAKSLRPLEPRETYKAVPRRVRGLDGQIRPN